MENALALSEKEAILGNESLKKLRLIKLKNKFSKRNKQIFLWREEIAEKDNVPPAYIFKDKHLKKLSNIESNDLSARKKIMLIIGDTDLTEKFMLNFYDIFLDFIFHSFYFNFSLISLFAKKRIIKIFIFSLSFALLATLWFRNPGENVLSPIFSSLILESTILASNGFLRILRPFFLAFLVTFFLSLIFWKKSKIKN